MKEVNGEVVSFYVSRTTAARTKWAKKIGLNASAIVDAILDKHFAHELQRAKEDKQKEIREAFNIPMP